MDEHGRAARVTRPRDRRYMHFRSLATRAGKVGGLEPVSVTGLARHWGGAPDARGGAHWRTRRCNRRQTVGRSFDGSGGRMAGWPARQVAEFGPGS